MAGKKGTLSRGAQGAMILGASMFAGAVTSQMFRGPMTNEQRAMMLGAGIAVLAGVVTGIVFIVIHFTRG